MERKGYSQKLSLNDRRRENKFASDMKKRGISKKDVNKVFNLYYANQVRALYNAVRNAD